MKLSKTVILLLLIISLTVICGFCMNNNKSENPPTKQEENLPEETPPEDNPPETPPENPPNEGNSNEGASPNENPPTEISDETKYLNFKERIINNSCFVMEREVSGQVEYLILVYYNKEKFYTITKTTIETHKIYTKEFVYTNNLANKVNATKSIEELKQEFTEEIFKTNWSFNKQITGENNNFTQCSMAINSENEIVFLFEEIENQKVIYSVKCKITLMEEINLKEIVPKSLETIA